MYHLIRTVKFCKLSLKHTYPCLFSAFAITFETPQTPQFSICMLHVASNWQKKLIYRFVSQQICRDALKGVKKAFITECRIMRDLKHANEDGVSRSLGYAFVNYSTHEHALFALRTLNNNPEIFDADKRPIVEFSLEDKRVLQIKEQRRLKQVAKNEEQKKLKMAKKEKVATTNKKALRIKKLREERRKKRSSSLKVCICGHRIQTAALSNFQIILEHFLNLSL